MANAFIIHPADSVVTVTEDIEAGSPVTYLLGEREIVITAVDPIPKYHKAAICAVPWGKYVYKYGEIIGVATEDIEIGRHVHTQNLTDVPREEQT